MPPDGLDVQEQSNQKKQVKIEVANNNYTE